VAQTSTWRSTDKYSQGDEPFHSDDSNLFGPVCNKVTCTIYLLIELIRFLWDLWTRDSHSCSGLFLDSDTWTYQYRMIEQHLHIVWQWIVFRENKFAVQELQHLDNLNLLLLCLTNLYLSWLSYTRLTIRWENEMMNFMAVFDLRCFLWLLTCGLLIGEFCREPENLVCLE
jgi:hypothetical protein